MIGGKVKRKKLRMKMLEREVNASELASLTGVTAKHMSFIVNDRTPGSIKWWKKAAEVLDCDIGDIIE